MRRFLPILAIIFFTVSSSLAQKKLVYNIGVGLNKSIGKDESNFHFAGNTITQYFNRQKYRNPYLNITGSVSYPLIKNCLIVLKSGIYVYFLEEYFTGVQRTTVSIPIELTARYKLFTMNKNSLGLDLSGGLNFFKIDDILEHYGNGQILNASLYYLINNKHLIKFGIEKQIDDVAFDLYKISQYSGEKIFNYKLDRLSISLSYSIQF